MQTANKIYQKFNNSYKYFQNISILISTYVYNSSQMKSRQSKDHLLIKKESLSRHRECLVLAIPTTILLIRLSVKRNSQQLILFNVELLNLALTENLEEHSFGMLFLSFQYILLTLPVTLVRSSLLNRKHGNNLTFKFHITTIFIWLNNNTIHNSISSVSVRGLSHRTPHVRFFSFPMNNRPCDSPL